MRLQGSLHLKAKLIVRILHERKITNRSNRMPIVTKINKNIQQLVAVYSSTCNTNKHQKYMVELERQPKANIREHADTHCVTCHSKNTLLN